MDETGSASTRTQRTLPVERVRYAVQSVRVALHSTNGSPLAEATGETVTVGTARDNDLRLEDPKVSRYHLSVRIVGAEVVVTDLGSTNGTRIGATRICAGSVAVDLGADLRVGDCILRVTDTGTTHHEIDDAKPVGGLIGTSAAMRRLAARIRRVAASPATVLVLGESGTGKELVARALHEESDRADGPFVTLDAAALTDSLFTSELFGHERGAFTGALTRHVGAFERAAGGTLFIDEIGELSEAMQAALLGAIERRRILRLGGKTQISIDVRLICATHRDLRARINSGQFRLDLYYRIAVVALELPPLRERVEDIEPLVRHFVQELGAGDRAPFAADQLDRLAKHPWPGNVRELRNVVARALVTCEDPALDDAGVESLEPSRLAESHPTFVRPFKEARRAVLDRFEVTYLERLLGRNGGSLRKSAREAGIDRSYLLQLLRRHGLRK